VSDLNKIPFGLRVSDDELVDVYDVPNGKQCGCVCPSCHTPLEARQGDRNVWHFGHASKKVYKETKNECEYSFYLSLRMMARQLIGNQLTLHLPELIGNIEYYEGILRYRQNKEFIVTKERNITIEALKVEDTFSGVAIDLIGSIESFKFVIYFTHPGRVVPDALFSPEDTKCGIIEISLDSLLCKFKVAKSESKTYHGILADFLTHDKGSKRWIFHPRFEQCAFSMLESLEKGAVNLTYNIIPLNPTNHSKYSIPKPFTPESQKLAKFYDFGTEKPLNSLVNFVCVMCDSHWEGYKAGGNICPKCNSHLYSKQIGESLSY